MDNYKQEMLLKKFPLLYYQFYWSASETCMCWGFSCGDGWYNILYQLSKEIDKLLPYKWWQRPFILSAIKASRWANKILRKFFPKCEYYINMNVFGVVQVKEKFGGLCFYMHNASEEIYQLVRVYEELASSTCETCGNEGVLVPGGWYYTTCTRCAKEHDRERVREQLGY